MEGNQYHDIKGHFTNEENDGGACYHNTFVWDRNDLEKIKELKAKINDWNAGDINRQINAIQEKQKSYYIDKFGKKHHVFVTNNKNGDELYFGKKDNEKNYRKFSSEDELKSFLEKNINDEEEFDNFLDENERKWAFLEKEYPELYEKVKKDIDEARQKRSIDRHSWADTSFIPMQSTLEHNGHAMDVWEKIYPDGKIYLSSFLGGEDRPFNTEDEREKVFKDFDKHIEKKQKEYEEYKIEEEKRKQKEKEEQEKNAKIKNNLYSNPADFKNKVYFGKLSEDELNVLDDEPITQGTRVGGYVGYSLSNSAVASKELGSMPMSQWNKEKILNYLEKSKDLSPFMDDFKKMKKDDLKDIVLYEDGWHHTSKMYNKTPFYAIKSPQGIIESLLWRGKRENFERGLKKGFGED